MSVTNAISSIIAIGALIQISPPLGEGVARPETWIRGLAFVGIVADLGQYVRRLCGHPPHARNVPQIGGRTMTDNLATAAYMGATILFILSLGGLSNPEILAPGQRVRHDRHGNRRRRHHCSGRESPRPVSAGSPAPCWSAPPLGFMPPARCSMTQMPELVALMHSLVGFAACTVGFASYIDTSMAIHRRRKLHSRGRDLHRRADRRRDLHRLRDRVRQAVRQGSAASRCFCPDGTGSTLPASWS